MHQERWAMDLKRILWENPTLGGMVIVIFAPSGAPFTVVSLLSLLLLLRLLALEFQLCRPNGRLGGGHKQCKTGPNGLSHDSETDRPAQANCADWAFDTSTCDPHHPSFLLITMWAIYRSSDLPD